MGIKAYVPIESPLEISRGKRTLAMGVSRKNPNVTASMLEKGILEAVK
jgi:hypothetical protein